MVHLLGFSVLILSFLMKAIRRAESYCQFKAVHLRQLIHINYLSRYVSVVKPEVCCPEVGCSCLYYVLDPLF